jgi:hypothetical protein
MEHMLEFFTKKLPDIIQFQLIVFSRACGNQKENFEQIAEKSEMGKFHQILVKKPNE